MVKRYDFDNNGNRLVGPDGIYVLASDYEKLEAAAITLIEEADLTCNRKNEEIAVGECPCAVCVLAGLAHCGEVDGSRR